MMDSVLKIDKLNKYYGKLHALDDISFQIQSGEVIGLLGHNGAGKSTLIKCLMGAIKSYSGRIYIHNKDIKQNQEYIMKNIGVLLEPSFCDYLSARKNLELLRIISDGIDNQKINSVLEMVSLKKVANKKVSEFSFGMKQRLGLAQVLLLNPNLIILDEPTVGLDPLGIEIIKKVIVECSKKNIAVLFSSHQINDVFDICNRVIVMNEGKIVYDGESTQLMKKTYILQVNCNVCFYEKELKAIVSDCMIDSNKIIFNQESMIDEILRFFIKKEIKIIDFSCESSIDGLKNLMQQ